MASKILLENLPKLRNSFMKDLEARQYAVVTLVGYIDNKNLADRIVILRDRTGTADLFVPLITNLSGLLHLPNGAFVSVTGVASAAGFALDSYKLLPGAGPIC